jgi:hypothetical protein
MKKAKQALLVALFALTLIVGGFLARGTVQPHSYCVGWCISRNPAPSITHAVRPAGYDCFSAGFSLC